MLLRSMGLSPSADYVAYVPFRESTTEPEVDVQHIVYFIVREVQAITTGNNPQHAQNWFIVIIIIDILKWPKQ